MFTTFHPGFKGTSAKYCSLLPLKLYAANFFVSPDALYILSVNVLISDQSPSLIADLSRRIEGE